MFHPKNSPPPTNFYPQGSVFQPPIIPFPISDPPSKIYSQLARRNRTRDIFLVLWYILGIWVRNAEKMDLKNGKLLNTVPKISSCDFRGNHNFQVIILGRTGEGIFRPWIGGMFWGGFWFINSNFQGKSAGSPGAGTPKLTLGDACDNHPLHWFHTTPIVSLK